MGKREHYITIATAIVAIVIGIFWLLNKMDGAAGLSYSDGLEPALVCLFGLSTLAVSIFNSVDNKSEVREIDHDVFYQFRCRRSIMKSHIKKIEH